MTAPEILEKVMEEMEQDKNEFIRQAVWYEKAKVRRYFEKAISLALQESSPKNPDNITAEEAVDTLVKTTEAWKKKVADKDSQIAELKQEVQSAEEQMDVYDKLFQDEQKKNKQLESKLSRIEDIIEKFDEQKIQWNEELGYRFQFKDWSDFRKKIREVIGE